MRAFVEPIPPPTSADINVLYLTIVGEGRGESDRAKLAIGWTVRNRAHRRRSSLAEAALKSIHYSCWNNARAMDANQLCMLTGDLGDKVFARCMIAALQVAHGLEPDPTDGATHYHHNTVSPDWAEGKRFVYLGAHKFYRNID